MKSGSVIKCVISLLLFFLAGFQQLKVENSAGKVMLGAYYFDGWTGKTTHITEALKTTYSNREPKWGWVNSNQKSIDEQIVAAQNAGLSFFSFCWYFDSKDKPDQIPMNQALKLYKESQYKNRLKYCLMVANHPPFEITPDSWDEVTDNWISEFKSGTYLKAEGKPLLIFFSIWSLITSFGSEKDVKIAFDQFRAKARSQGIDGISIAGCSDGGGYDQARKCGFDLLTGYNYHGKAFKTVTNQQQIPIDSMQQREVKLWTGIATRSKFKYIPVSTLNWDPRPWATAKNKYNTAPYYVGFSESSVYRSASNLIQWVKANPDKTTTEQIALLYAWNENGEGAYLTPTNNGPDLLRGLKKAVYENGK